MRSVRLIFILILLVVSRLNAAETNINFLTKLQMVPPLPAVQKEAEQKHIPLAGFTASSETNLSPGDMISMLVDLHEKNHRETQWLMTFTVTNANQALPRDDTNSLVLYTSTGRKFEFNDSPVNIQVRIIGPVTERTGQNGSLNVIDKAADVVVNRAYLELGLDQATMAIRRLHSARQTKNGELDFNYGIGDQPFTEKEIREGQKMAAQLQMTFEEERALVGSVPVFDGYFTTVQHTPGLDAILFKVISLPSLWSIASNAGISVDIRAGHPADRVGKVALDWPLPPNVPLYAMPLEIRLNRHLSLTLTTIVTAAKPPLLACGGIIGFLAENPDDPQNYLTLRILGSQKGMEKSAAN